MVRIITGSKKGKKLITPEGEATRPTSERIKEAMFSSIQFDVENRRVLDLFAGCGQLGFESLSRGSGPVTFIDAAREAMDIVKANAKALGYFDRCKYLVSDYRNYIRKAAGTATFDLVFIDPPYAMECAADALTRLVNAGMLAKGAIAVLESGTESFSPEKVPGFEIKKSTHYGKKTFVNILVYRGAEE